MSGLDDKGSTYPNINEMWQIELHNKQTEANVVERVGSVENWYKKANEYWEKSQPTYDGVLGGYGNLNKKDINFSLTFLLSLVKLQPKFNRGSVIDCGAGIGRISNELLCQTFKTIDVIDQCGKLIEKSKQILKEKKNVRHFYVKGLQEFDFEEKYDCIWVQWVFSHLNDEDAKLFLQKAKKALNDNGFLIIKENHCKYGFVVDKQDFSVTRSSQLFHELFAKSGLKVIREQIQSDWPQDLFGIRMYALQ